MYAILSRNPFVVIYVFFGVNFILQKSCLCKKKTNIRYGGHPNLSNFLQNGTLCQAWTSPSLQHFQQCCNSTYLQDHSGTWKCFHTTFLSSKLYWFWVLKCYITKRLFQNWSFGWATHRESDPVYNLLSGWFTCQPLHCLVPSWMLSFYRVHPLQHLPLPSPPVHKVWDFETDSHLGFCAWKSVINNLSTNHIVFDLEQPSWLHLNTEEKNMRRSFKDQSWVGDIWE